MSNSPSFEDWLIADVLSRPAELYVLWALHDGLCSSAEDFSVQFDADIEVHRIIDWLEQRHFVRREGSVLEPTESARNALARLDLDALQSRAGRLKNVVREQQLAILRQGVQVWNEWKAKSRVVIPDLRGAGLVGAALVGADLSLANLTGANLSGVDLHGANLRETSLHRANLHDTHLQEANLFEVDLSYADLSGADVTGANLSNANLTGADLRGANLLGADLRGTDLSGSA